MTSQELHKLLEDAASVRPAQTLQLEKILEKYPYFQAARAVHLKGLYTEDSLSYNYELKKTAAYTADRSVLFDFITSEEFQQDKIALQIKKQEEHLRNITVFEPQEVFGRKSIAIDDAISMKKTESDRVMDPGLFEKPTQPVVQPQPIEDNRKEEVNETPLIKGEPLNFDRHESHSFSEWLRLTSAKPIEREEEDNSKLRDRKFELIDDFISKSPRIDTSIPAGNSNFAKERSVPPEALMTETLARVYLEQKNYKKAIQAYKILILKNPEKSGFFADQIRAIKKLQDNNTGTE
ncbi:MAG TPA: hypothetical protein VLN46_02980 [Gillisia sp.]|nr:hypothetical protein [Gillisia sp.]